MHEGGGRWAGSNKLVELKKKKKKTYRLDKGKDWRYIEMYGTAISPFNSAHVPIHRPNNRDLCFRGVTLEGENLET